MPFKFSVSNYFKTHAALFNDLDISSFQEGIEIVRNASESGKKIITCGNGGSALTASHYVTDWNKMINLSTGKKFRGISLCDNLGLITAFGNDLEYSDVFSGQLASIMDKGDLLIAVSGSGNSPNIIKAVNTAREMGGKVLSLVGFDGGKLKPLSDHCIWVESNDMQLCEDLHLMFGHMVLKALCGLDIH